MKHLAVSLATVATLAPSMGVSTPAHAAPATNPGHAATSQLLDSETTTSSASASIWRPCTLIKRCR